MNAPFPGSFINPNRRRNMWIAASIAAVILAVGLAFGVAQNANPRDDASYSAGRSTGVSWAQDTMHTSGPGSARQAVILGTAGPGFIPDSEILGTCPEQADFAQKDLVYYYSGGQINGRDIKRDDFISGCVDGARSVVGAESK
jgi:hypothetical protein